MQTKGRRRSESDMRHKGIFHDGTVEETRYWSWLIFGAVAFTISIFKVVRRPDCPTTATVFKVKSWTSYSCPHKR
jgi:hypothetical protein